MNIDGEGVTARLRLERCIVNAEEARVALGRGAFRAELCEHLDVGGVTLSEDNIRECVATGLPINVLVRPRGGDFVYDEAETARMLSDIALCGRLGVNGVVVGALRRDGSVDIDTVRRLVEAAKDAGIPHLSFHRAFDRCSEPFAALEQIVALGFDTLLTSGCKPTAMEGADLLAELVRRADGRIDIMPGSGVTPQNLPKLRELTGATVFHGTKLCAGA